jgi:alpha-N-arabinofuranosidase
MHKETETMVRTLFALIALTLAAPAMANTEIEGQVQTDQPGPAISRHIYGQFVEHLGTGVYDGIWVGPNSPIPNTRGIRNDVVSALKELSVPVVRWPGGCFADEYHWRDGIGPREKRPVRKNNWWDGVETNAFGTHEFFDFAKMIGADTYLSVNVASSNPSEMREWLEYLTSKGQDSIANERRANGRDGPFKVDFVGIGNESWGCGGNMTPDYYANELRRFGTFFHKKGFGFHDKQDNIAARVASGANNLDTNWTDVVTKQAGHQMDAISLHFYALKTGEWTNRNLAKAIGFPDSEWNGILYQAMRMDDVLKAHEAVLDRNDPKKRIGLFVDEWGTWYAPEPGTNPAHAYQQNSLRDALVAAGTLNIFHRHTARVRMANIAQGVNVLQAMLLTDGAKMVRTPTYHVFRMYKPFQDATPYPVMISPPTIETPEGRFPAFNITAARAKDGSLSVAVANMALKDGYRISLDLGAQSYRRVSGEVLTHARMDAHNVPGQPEIISPMPFKAAKIDGKRLVLDVPAKAVVVVRLN